MWTYENTSVCSKFTDVCMQGCKVLGSEGNERREHYSFPELERLEKDKGSFQADVICG